MRRNFLIALAIAAAALAAATELVIPTNTIPLRYVGDNTHAWWFEPKIEGLSSAGEVMIPTTTITNNEDIITYSGLLKPLVFQLGYDVIAGRLLEEITYESAQGLVDIDANTGLATSIASGTDTIRLVSPSLTREIQIEASISPPGYFGYQENLAAHQYDPESVKFHVNTNMAALISGHDGSESDLAIYSLQDHSATNYIRNTNSWAYTLDLTCASPWNSTGDGSKVKSTGFDKGQFRAATAITPKHLLSSEHYHCRQTWNNSTHPMPPTIRFVTQDNQVIERQVVAHEAVLVCDPSVTNTLSDTMIYELGYTNLLPDFVVLQLDEELPATITPAKRLPDHWLTYFPYKQGYQDYLNNQRYHPNFPIVMTDQQERATIGENWFIGLSTILTRSDNGYSTTYFSPPNKLIEIREDYAEFYRHKINGDSSSPQLLFIDNQPVLTGTLTTGGGGGSRVSTAWCHNEIQRIITEEFGDTNIWEAVDLSGYKYFGEPPPEPVLVQHLTTGTSSNAVAVVGPNAPYTDIPVLDFDGVGDNINSGTTFSPGTNDFEMGITLADAVSGVDYRNLWGYWDSVNGNITIHRSVSSLYVVRRTAAGVATATYPAGWAFDPDPSVFHTYSVKRIGDTFYYYTDGVPSATTSNVGTNSFGPFTLLGMSSKPTANYQSGTVSRLWASTNNTMLVDYRLEEGYGSTVFDVSGNGNHGTIAGATWTVDNALPIYNPSNYVHTGTGYSIVLADGSTNDYATLVAFTNQTGLIHTELGAGGEINDVKVYEIQ